MKNPLKMTVKKLYLSLLLSLFTLGTIHAQKPQNRLLIEQNLNDSILQNQYDVMVEKSPVFQGYKNIKIEYVNQFSKNLKDSIQNFNAQIDALIEDLDKANKQITALEQDVIKRKETISNLNQEKESFEAFGLKTTKSSFSNLMLTIIIALLIGLLFFAYQFKNANTVTKKAKLDLSELETEFEQHRKTALKREQKVMRKLQDEINKNKQA